MGAETYHVNLVLKMNMEYGRSSSEEKIVGFLSLINELMMLLGIATIMTAICGSSTMEDYEFDTRTVLGRGDVNVVTTSLVLLSAIFFVVCILEKMSHRRTFYVL